MDSPTLLIKVHGHPTYYVREGDVFKIGRNKNNNLTLSDPTVSRTHAIIKWEEKYPLISDCKSTAGMLVDGKRIKFIHLHSFHSITLGETRILLEYAQGQADTPTEVDTRILSSAVLRSLDESDEATLFYEAGSSDQNGFLETTDSIQKLLIHLETGKRTGTLTLTNNLRIGKLLLARGKIKQAVCGSISGERALQRLCKFPNARYHFTVIFDVQEAPLNISAACYMRNLRKAATMRRVKRPTPGKQTSPR